MTALRRILVAALAVLGAVLFAITVTFLLADDATLVSLIIRGIESASDSQIHYAQGARVTRTLAPVLSIRQLVVDDNQGRYRIETPNVEVQLRLPSLLSGQLEVPHLRIGATRVHILKTAAADRSRSTASEPRSPATSVLPVEAVLGDAQIAAVSILRGSEKLQLPPTRIHELSLRARPGKPLWTLAANLEVADERLSIDAMLPLAHRASQAEPLPFKVSVHSAATELSATGRVDFRRPTPAVQGAVRLHVPDLGKIPLPTGRLRVPGGLTAQTRLNGTFDQLALEDLSADWAGPGKSVLRLSGRIADATALDGIDLALSGRLEQADWLTPLLPPSLGALRGAKVAVRVAGKRSRLALRTLSLEASTAQQLHLSLTGRLDLVQLPGAPQAENMELALAFDAPTTRAARALLFDDIPEFGAIRATADIRSGRGDPALENIRIRATDPKGIEVDLTGHIARFPLDPQKPNKGYDLDVAMQAASASAMITRLGLNLPLSGPLNLHYRIEGDTQALELKQVKLSAGEKKATLLEAQGQILFRDWDRPDPLRAIDLVLHVQARNTDFLNRWLKQPIPPLAYRAQARLHTVAGRHRLDDFRLTTADGGPLRVALSGSAAQISILPQLAVDGIHIKTRLTTPDVARLAALFKLDGKIPPLGPLTADFLLSGSDKRLLVADLDLSAGREEVLLVKGKGRVGYLGAAANWQPEDTDLHIDAHSAHSQSLAEALGYRLPPLGPLSGHARIHRKDRRLGVQSIELLVGDSDRPVLKSRGSIGDLYGLKDIHLATVLHLREQDITASAPRKDAPDIGTINGSMVISDRGDSLGIDSLHIKSTRTEPLSVNIDGRFDDFRNPETLSMNAHLKARDLQLLGVLVDRHFAAIGPVRFDAQIKQSGDYTQLNGSATLGKAEAEIVLSGDLNARPPGVRGKITARKVFFQDPFDKVAAARAAEKKGATGPAAPLASKTAVFSRRPIPFEWLKKADLDLAVLVESFEPGSWEARSARFEIALKSGHLSIDPAEFVYPKGKLELALEVDGDSPPQVEFKASGQNINPWGTLGPKTSPAKAGVNTEEDVEITLRTHGVSPHELASHLRGEVYMTVKGGLIRRSMLDLLFVDIVGWSVNKVKRDKFASIECGVLDFSIEEGIVTTNGLFMDLPDITITGEGRIDLGREQIDYVFVPKKKSRLVLKAEPVTIKGPLGDPSIHAIPVKSAALTFGTLVFAPYVFAGVAAADYVHGRLTGGKDEASACLKYEQARKKAAGNNNQPVTPGIR